MADRTGRTATLLLTPILVLAVAACTSAGAGPSSSPPGSPVATPAASPSAADVNVFDHPTGPTDIVLRYDETAGFVMPGFAATMVPPFTLYGDGTIVFRDPTIEMPPAEGTITKANPLRTAKLTEAQIQDLLKLALDEGGLAVARPEYRNMMVADAGTAIFTIQAGGVTKTVSVYALGIDDPSSPDAAAMAAFSKLAQTLTSIEKGGVIKAVDYVPTGYRGILMEDPGIQGAATAWPWTDIAVADFKPDADPNGLQFPHRTLTPADLDALGITGYTGGLQNVLLKAPDGKSYTLSVRPLLPDEQS